jgi:glycosyltransferase involved in cell wall biosynthesis
MTSVHLSMCLITYNHARFIEGAIQSVLSQKVDVPWEFIISDDGSTDGTAEIVRKYAEQYPALIRPIFHQKNLGPATHFLEMIGTAKGTLMAYLEGDDAFADDEKLQTQIDYLRRNPNFIGCFHDLVVIDEQGAVVAESFLASSGSTFKSSIEQRDLLNAGGLAHMNTWVYRRHLLEDLPKWVADFPLDKSLGFYLAEHGNWGYIDKRMTIYRLHSGGMYSPLPEHHQNQMLLKHVMALYSVPEFRTRYETILRMKICHYCRRIAASHKKFDHAYWAGLATYLRYHPKKMTALKVLITEELLDRSATAAH